MWPAAENPRRLDLFSNSGSMLGRLPTGLPGQHNPCRSQALCILSCSM